MYAWPVLLPIFSNREDFLITDALFDDDTGEAIDLTGRTLAAPGPFTSSAWTVVDGAIATSSITKLTIPDYPINNELQAVALIVGANLDILAGDQITISDTQTGLNSMNGTVTSYVAATGALVCQIGSSFDFEIRSHNSHLSDDYGTQFAMVGTDDSQPLITAQLGSGITIIGLGTIQIRVPASTMQKLRNKTYMASLALYNGPDTRQIFVGKLPMIGGGVSTAPFAVASSSNPFGLP
jgi:hypothetical protein